MLPFVDDSGRIDNAFAQVLRGPEGTGAGEIELPHGGGRRARKALLETPDRRKQRGSVAMSLLVGCDNAAVSFKEKILAFLRGRNVEVEDVGVHYVLEGCGHISSASVSSLHRGRKTASDHDKSRGRCNLRASDCNFFDPTNGNSRPKSCRGRVKTAQITLADFCWRVFFRGHVEDRQDRERMYHQRKSGPSAPAPQRG